MLHTLLRSVLIGAGSVTGALALGFGLRLPWATTLWLGLAVAIAIILSSGALALFYLFINRDTRVWSAAPTHAQAGSLTSGD